VFAATLFFGTNLYASRKTGRHIYDFIHIVLPLCAAAYIIIALISICVGKFIFTDARGSILLFQFILASIMIPNIDYLLTNTNREEPEQKSSTANQTRHESEHLIVRIGDNLLPLPLESIAYIYSSDRKTSIGTMDGRTYGYNRSLDSIMTEVGDLRFFRANKQFIISRNAVEKMTVWFDNRLLVSLKSTETPEPIYVSKNKAAKLKQWIAG